MWGAHDCSPLHHLLDEVLLLKAGFAGCLPSASLLSIDVRMFHLPETLLSPSATVPGIEGQTELTSFRKEPKRVLPKQLRELLETHVP